MENFIAMLDHKSPMARRTKWYLKNAGRIAAQVVTISRLRARRPAAYEQAMTALVNWAASRAAGEIEEKRLARRNALEGYNES